MKAQPISHHSLTEETVTQLLVTVQPEITRMARSLYYRIYSLSLSIDDLVQEGWIAAWKATTRYNPDRMTSPDTLRRYCLVCARFAMLSYVRKMFRRPSCSLEEYLEKHLSFQI